MYTTYIGQQLAHQFKVLFFELSAKQSDISIINEVFHQLVLKLPKNNNQELLSLSDNKSAEKYHITIPKRKTSNCC